MNFERERERKGEELAFFSVSADSSALCILSASSLAPFPLELDSLSVLLSRPILASMSSSDLALFSI